uniref:39S ribosomal protein L52, mitochondrial n=1 Tax=Moschus moschiferus TaxID=68415 RepID=A0A8C6E5K4_MOSMO
MRVNHVAHFVLLSQEMDAGLQAWQLRQQEKLQKEDRKQQNALKPTAEPTTKSIKK